MLSGTSITVNILGCCVLAETEAQGVIDPLGRVFGYPGLYVADGSAVPVNLNANPALTITALVEYFMANIPAKN